MYMVCVRVYVHGVRARVCVIVCVGCNTRCNTQWQEAHLCSVRWVSTTNTHTHREREMPVLGTMAALVYPPSLA
jgi:hypothetical protein